MILRQLDIRLILIEDPGENKEAVKLFEKVSQLIDSYPYPLCHSVKPSLIRTSEVKKDAVDDADEINEPD